MRHEAQNREIIGQFTKQAEAYAELTKDLGDPSLEPILNAVRLTPADEVLDVACGAGGLTLSLAKIARHATGIDLTAAMVDQARALQIERNIENVDWHVADILPLPFKDSAFSVVISRAAFHPFADPAGVLDEMIRVCGSAGRIAVIDLTPAATKSSAFDMIERLRDPSHTHALTVEELRDLGRRSGLKEITVSAVSTPPIPLEAVLATSFPHDDDMKRVRELYRQDAETMNDDLGLSVTKTGEEIVVTYPLSLVVWTRDHRRQVDNDARLTGLQQDLPHLRHISVASVPEDQDLP
jgi:ubiquinone/menaquinone biosynthesis C-methylase UbiE